MGVRSVSSRLCSRAIGVIGSLMLAVVLGLDLEAGRRVSGRPDSLQDSEPSPPKQDPEKDVQEWHRELRTAVVAMTRAPGFRVVSRFRAGRSQDEKHTIDRPVAFHYAAARAWGRALHYPSLEAYRDHRDGVIRRGDTWRPLLTTTEGRWLYHLHPHPRRAVADWFAAGGEPERIVAPTQERGELDEPVVDGKGERRHLRLKLSRKSVRESYARLIQSGAVTNPDESVSPFLDSVDQTRLSGFAEFTWEASTDDRPAILRSVDVYLIAPLGGSLRGGEEGEHIVVQFRLLWTKTADPEKFEIPADARRAWP